MKTNYPSKPEPGFNFVNGTIMMAKTDTIRTAAPFKTIFPIREDVLNRITTDMKQHGFDSGHPIVVWAGKKLTVVDGHTRLLAATNLGIEVIPVVLREFADENAALEYAIGSQRNRRNLTDAELMKCISALDKRKKTGRPKNRNIALGRSASATAQLLGTSRGKVEKLRAINDHGTETIKLAVLSGELTANRAYIITMEARRMNDCKSEDEFKSARLILLEKSISKGIRERTDLELRKHPDVRYAPAEIHAMKGKIISKLDEALGKLKKGKN